MCCIVHVLYHSAHIVSLISFISYLWYCVIGCSAAIWLWWRRSQVCPEAFRKALRMAIRNVARKAYTCIKTIVSISYIYIYTKVVGPLLNCPLPYWLVRSYIYIYIYHSSQRGIDHSSIMPPSFHCGFEELSTSWVLKPAPRCPRTRQMQDKVSPWAHAKPVAPCTITFTPSYGPTTTWQNKEYTK